MVGSSSIVLGEKRCEWKASLWAMADQHEQPGHWKKEQVNENEAGCYGMEMDSVAVGPFEIGVCKFSLQDSMI